MQTVVSAVAQVAVFIFGASAIWLVSRKGPERKWGYLLGLCGQPFWFYLTLSKGQYGIFALCLWYTYSWGQGVWFHILKR